MRVLVVENDPDVLDVVLAILSDFDIEATGATDPSQAIGLLNTERWDVLLSDVLFPDRLDGFAVAAVAARLATPCILMSGDVHQTERVADRGLAFLAKPFSMADLIAAVTAPLALPLAA